MRLLAIAALLSLAVGGAAAEPAWHRPVKTVADGRFTVTTPTRSGTVPIYTSDDWSHPLPAIKRVVIVMHGIGRDADSYMRGAESARAAAGAAGQTTLLVVPQFLADIDSETFRLPPTMLHWNPDNWPAGEPAHGPAPFSTFDVFDALLQRMADRALLPNLDTVVVAGHSAGGQIVQRYAIVGHGEAPLIARGIHIRYVVANPSSYLYFSDDRPQAVNATACPNFNRWRYGFQGAPPYVGNTAGLEQRFVTRDVVYLLGTADTNPAEADLDTSCAGEAEGPYRFARGMSYFAYLKARHPGDLAHRLIPVEGVAHSGGRMFNSACGLSALFGRAGCEGL
jgi:pimeloyl-ACP methyl ester carboxylesterase